MKLERELSLSLKKPLFWLVSALIILGIVVFLLVLRTEEAGEVQDARVVAQSEQRQYSPGSNPEVARSDAGIEKRKRRSIRLPKNAIDRKKRAEVLALILSALQEKERKKDKTYSKESLRPTGLPPEYIREAVHEIRPLLKECYMMELEDRGLVKGKLVFGFDLIADDEHGGLVEEVQILESELSKEISDSFAECLRETIYSLRLEAPARGGRYTVRYPVVFSAGQ